ncbi:zinc-ribbon domain-containing protein [bacterium]|nr:zinc-ribbon domain-containing protein [bacterium]
MKTQSLALTDPSLLAEFVGPEMFKAFFEKRFEVPPDNIGLLMRNGQFVEAYTGAHLSVGGLFNQIKGAIGGSQSISLLIADSKPFPVSVMFRGLSRDKVEIAGLATIELQVNPEKPSNIIGMMTARKALSKSDVGARLSPHLSDRVVEHSLARVDATDVRGNKGLQDMVQADIMREAERVLGDVGILVRAVSMEWALNEVERGVMERAAAVREIERIEFNFESLKREIEREHETTAFRIEADTDIDKLNLQSEADLRRLVVDQELDLVDARETGQRLQETKILQHEIEMMKTEQIAKLEGQLRTISNLTDVKELEEKRRTVERETARLDMMHNNLIRALQRDFDAETRALEREEQLTNRRVDRDYDYDTRDKDLDIKEKERDFGFDTRRKEVDVSEKEKKSEIEITGLTNRTQREHLKGLQDLEKDIERDRLDRKIKEKDADHQRDLEMAKLRAQRKADEMHLAKNLTPEQLLALNAMDEKVSNVLIEQARARSNNQEDMVKLMREMVTQANAARVSTEQQALAMFQTGMQGAAGVAAGAGSKDAMAAAGIGGAKVECPKCGRENDAKSRFCLGCGHQLRA